MEARGLIRDDEAKFGSQRLDSGDINGILEVKRDPEKSLKLILKPRQNFARQ